MLDIHTTLCRCACVLRMMTLFALSSNGMNGTEDDPPPSPVHVGGRVAQLPWKRHEQQIFVLGIVLFWTSDLRAFGGAQKQGYSARFALPRVTSFAAHDDAPFGKADLLAKLRDLILAGAAERLRNELSADVPFAGLLLVHGGGVEILSETVRYTLFSEDWRWVGSRGALLCAS
jgi:hypothetical protein